MEEASPAGGRPLSSSERASIPSASSARGSPPPVWARATPGNLCCWTRWPPRRV